MWDNRDSLTEILDAIEQDGKFFGIVQLQRAAQKKRLRFGINHQGYTTLKKILQLLPFDQLPGINYRYFFIPCTGRMENNKASMTVRVEQGQTGKLMNVVGDLDLVANLMWFHKLKDLQETNHLVSI